MLKYWLWLAHRPEINEHVKVLLLQSFQTPMGVYLARQEEYDIIPGLKPSGKQALADKGLERFEAVVSWCGREQVQILTYDDPAYPRRLKSIYNPPLVLYCKGTMPRFDGVPVISIVGTRRCTDYGASVAEQMGREISRGGGLVVSGLAEGIDAAAMAGALDAGFPTVGVLGTGIDLVYPAVNRPLFQRVERQGCLLSELLPGTRGSKWSFPKRNRIISGLSLAVVVAESPERSGTYHTVQAALDQNRDVYTVPGEADWPTFAGNNRLLAEGASPVRCGWDVLREYTSLFPDTIRRVQSAPVRSRPAPQKSGFQKKDIDNRGSGAYIDPRTSGLSQEEQAVLRCLQAGQTLVDDVIAATGIPSGKLLGTLTMMEIKGILRRLPGNRLGLR